jgi:cytochrome c oxidase subunit II
MIGQLILLLAFASPSAFDAAGPSAGRIAGLTLLMIYVLSAIFILTMIALAIAAFRRQRQLPPPEVNKEVIPSEHEREKRLSRTVTTAVLVSAAILLVFLVSSFLTGRAIVKDPDRTNALIIEVNGNQWWWDVRYDHPVASQIVTTANEIHIPVGRPILLRLGSRDVIHSFWVPNLHGKMDMVPGRTYEFAIQADRPDVYRGQCAEYCGHQHAHMALLVIAEPEEQFNAWYQAQLQPAPAPVTASQINGQKIFLSRPCVMCHRIQGTDAGGRLGPDLTHVASRQTIAAGTLNNSREHLSRWIANSQNIKPGNRMPPNLVTGDDLNSLLDYVQSLK